MSLLVWFSSLTVTKHGLIMSRLSRICQVSGTSRSVCHVHGVTGVAATDPRRCAAPLRESAHALGLVCVLGKVW